MKWHSLHVYDFMLIVAVVKTVDRANIYMCLTDLRIIAFCLLFFQAHRFLDTGLLLRKLLLKVDMGQLLLL